MTGGSPAKPSPSGGNPGTGTPGGPYTRPAGFPQPYKPGYACTPGSCLSSGPVPTQREALAGLGLQLWSPPSPPKPGVAATSLLGLSLTPRSHTFNKSRDPSARCRPVPAELTALRDQPVGCPDGGEPGRGATGSGGGGTGPPGRTGSLPSQAPHPGDKHSCKLPPHSRAGGSREGRSTQGHTHAARCPPFSTPKPGLAMPVGERVASPGLTGRPHPTPSFRPTTKSSPGHGHVWGLPASLTGPGLLCTDPPLEGLLGPLLVASVASSCPHEAESCCPLCSPQEGGSPASGFILSLSSSSPGRGGEGSSRTQLRAAGGAATCRQQVKGTPDEVQRCLEEEDEEQAERAGGGAGGGRSEPAPPRSQRHCATRVFFTRHRPF